MQSRSFTSLLPNFETPLTIEPYHTPRDTWQYHTLLSLPNTATITWVFNFWIFHSCKKRRPKIMPFTQESVAPKGKLELQLSKWRAEQDLIHRGLLLHWWEALTVLFQILLFTWTPDWQALCAFSIDCYKKKYDVLDLQSLNSHRFVNACTWSKPRSKKGKSCQICQKHRRFTSFSWKLTFTIFFIKLLQIIVQNTVVNSCASQLQGVLRAQ